MLADRCPSGVAGGRTLRGLDPIKAARLRALFARLGDGQVTALVMALQAGASGGGAARHAYDLLLAEREDRQARDQVFAPLAPLARAAAQDPGLPLPPNALRLLWRVLRDEMGPRVDRVARAVRDLSAPDDARRACDVLALDVAEALDAGLPPWDALAAELDAVRPGGARALAQHLRLAPMARVATPRLRSWVRTASPEHASALKLAYRDATGLGEDAPPRLLRMLAGQLDHPWQVLRLVEAVMDRPSDRFLAASELGAFAEQVLDGVDAGLKLVGGFDPAHGEPAATAAARAACEAVAALAEFDRCIDLKPGGAWAKRIAGQRRTLARAVEARLRKADGALAAALPVVGGSFGGVVRGTPRLDGPLDEALWSKAVALIAFLAGVRGGADDGGFATVRSKATEAVDLRLSDYADDLVRTLHEEPDTDAAAEARTRLGLIADLLGLVRDARAAELIRRRVAAAGRTVVAVAEETDVAPAA